MDKQYKKIRVPLITATTVTLIAFVYFGYQQYKMSNRLDQLAALVSADQALFNLEYDKAFDLYDELSPDFFNDSLLELRKNMVNNYLKKEDSNSFFNDNQIKEDLIAFIANCKVGETPNTLTEKSDIELVKMLKDCYRNVERQKANYKGKIENKKDLSYLRINAEKNIHYFGELSDGEANGHGVGIWENQSFYEGEWKNNMRHGFGKFTTEKGEVYEGEYQNNKRNGKGTYVFRNGDYYTGEWKDSGRSGFGTVISSKGDTLVHGFWEKDRFDQRRTRNELGSTR